MIRECVVTSRDRRVCRKDGALLHRSYGIVQGKASVHELPQAFEDHESGVPLIHVPDTG